MFQKISKRCEAVATYRCPCCLSKTLCGRAADEICPVCFWQDDGQDEHDAEDVRGGPNKALSLRQGQANFQKFGAIEERFQNNVRKAHDDEL